MLVQLQKCSSSCTTLERLNVGGIEDQKKAKKNGDKSGIRTHARR